MRIKISINAYIKNSFILFAATFVILDVAAFAQESNYKFYPHDYALSPFEGQNGEGQPTPGQGTSKSTNSNLPQSTPGPVSIIPGSDIVGKPIESLSLLTDGLDFKSLKTQVELLLRIFNERNVRPAALFSIGESAQSYPKDLQKLLARLNILGVYRETMNKPPENLQITKVPTWIVTLKEGDIVLEGIDSPEKFINAKGEFIDPKKFEGDHEE